MLDYWSLIQNNDEGLNQNLETFLLWTMKYKIDLVHLSQSLLYLCWLTNSIGFQCFGSQGGFHIRPFMEKETVKPSESKLVLEKALKQICTTQSNKFTSTLPGLNGI